VAQQLELGHYLRLDGVKKVWAQQTALLVDALEAILARFTWMEECAGPQFILRKFLR